MNVTLTRLHMHAHMLIVDSCMETFYSRDTDDARYLNIPFFSKRSFMFTEKLHLERKRVKVFHVC